MLGMVTPKGFEIRAGTLEHHAGLCELAQHLDTVNLPNDPEALRTLLSFSERSFRGEITDPRRREYVFVLLDHEQARIVGTSMVIAQLGRRDAPYIYFDVRREEKYSETLDRHFVHTILTSSYSYDGPTEVGGLVVHPDYRMRPERLGTLISYVRFLFIAMRRRDMRDQVLAELLPPLEADGTSHLWEAIGRRFTGLTYREADKLSRRNKEFIKGLFPDHVYATLLSEPAQRMIGAVGVQTQGVEKLLRRIGFEYAERVDPFDGGPHFIADTDAISLVRRSLELEAVIDPLAGSTPPPGAPAWLAGSLSASPPYFVARACSSPDGGQLRLAGNEAKGLRVEPGDRVWALPLG